MFCRVLFFSLLLFCFDLNAKQTDFAYSDEWLKLVHYQPKIFGGYKATIGSESFYLSPCGKTNPEKELDATIALFQSNDDKTKCLFPARYMFLKKNGLINYDFPDCNEYEQFKKDLQPSGITFLFTDAYMNNSSSLFGHTLLRVDTARKGTQLLAHGINYGAYTRGYEDSFLYAIYGLIGAYPGGFTTKPYYDIINTYNNLENRDIWEYGLNLTQDELDFFIAHIWELGQTLTPYYFFTQNCSYMLMEALDAVKPDLNLAQDFKIQTIPLDTIKAVNSKQGLIKSVNYRPSRERKIRYRIGQMNKKQYTAFLKLIKEEKNDFLTLSDEEQADVLETAYQYVQYQYVAEKLELKDYRKKSFAILRQRNKLNSKPKFDELKEGFNPADSHDSAMVSLGVGAKNGNVFEQISLRPAYHSLTDNKNGFLTGAEINFLDTIFRHYDSKDKFVLEKINILELSSLSPIDHTFSSPSYNITLNVDRKINPKTTDEGYVANISVGSGGTFSLSDNIHTYLLSSLDGAYGGFLPNNQYVGAGVSIGVLGLYDKFGIQGEIKKVYATSSIGSNLKYKLKADCYLTRNITLEAFFSYQKNKGKNLTENIFSIKKHF